MASNTLADGKAPPLVPHVRDVIDHIDERAADRDASLSARPKDSHILAACERRDIDELKQLAISNGGLLTDALRRQAWPILLGFEPSSQKGGDDASGESGGSWRQMQSHRDEDQVRLDVDRSFVYYPNDNSQAQLDQKKAELFDLIIEVLRRQPYLCYFQGYHDICQVFLLVLPPPSRALAVSRLSVLRIRDFMLPSLSPSIAHLRLIPDILSAVDPALYAHLSRTEPYFALADTLTMFAHNIQRYGDIARLFDALLAREQVFSIYIFAQIVLGRREELFAHDEADMLHFTLTKLPPDLDLDVVIVEASALLGSHPPESLPSWRSISRASVLKTARHVGSCARQTLDEGGRFFETQSSELQWSQRREQLLRAAWANKTIILAVLLGVGSAVYMRRSSFWSGILVSCTSSSSKR